MKGVLASIVSLNRYGHAAARRLEIVEASPGRVVFEVTIDDDMMNLNGAIHGGCVAYLFDLTTSLALVSQNAFPGTSVDLSTQYVSAGKLGETMLITAEVVKAGGMMGYLRGSMKEKTTGRVVATASHVKFIKKPNM
ncbi:HotDog domain-containing protein [Gaertneriomyces semiglobifer]|nr:HotDog domain-containing protein [Gaertneriomyces semiglobifer]